jgi:hypothetical protein
MIDVNVIELASELQFRWFVEAMNILNRHKRELSDYDLVFYRKMRDGWDFSKRNLTLTVKQMNYLRQIAREVEEGTYDGDS